MEANKYFPNFHRKTQNILIMAKVSAIFCLLRRFLFLFIDLFDLIELFIFFLFFFIACFEVVAVDFLLDCSDNEEIGESSFLVLFGIGVPCWVIRELRYVNCVLLGIRS